MKKIFKYFALAAIVTAALASCNKNEAAEFDDSNAFVAFDEAVANIDEDSADTLRIAVTLASVKGLEERIGYTVTNGTAKADTNFVVVDSTATLSFDKDHRTAYIEIIPIADGLYTGDLKFTITLNESDNIALGSASKCEVTVNDIDHPLTPILGTYKFNGESYFRGALEGDIQLLKDEEDDHMVWFQDVFFGPGGTGPRFAFYGNVNDGMTEIVIPFGQTITYKHGGLDVYVFGSDADLNIYETGALTVTVDVAAGKLDFGNTNALSLIEPTAPAYFEYYLPGMVAIKK